MSLPDECLLQDTRRCSYPRPRMCSRWLGMGGRGGLLGGHGPGQERGVTLRPTHHSVDRFEQLVLLDRLEVAGRRSAALANSGRSPSRSRDVSRMMRVAASSALSRIMAATVRPSASGMRASSSTQLVRPAVGGAVPQGVRWPPSRRPPPWGPSAEPCSHSSRMCRLVALSSTTSTGRLWSETGWTGAGSGGAAVGRGTRAGEGEECCAARQLSTVIVPPIGATSREAMVRPRPVPPYLRVVEVSSARKARKMRLLLLGRDADAGVAHGEAEADLLPPETAEGRRPGTTHRPLRPRPV